MRAFAKVLLVAATVVCGASMGGAMLVAAPVLVPLHWSASRESGGWGAGAWAVLASASAFEWSWMATYALSEAAGPSTFAGLAAFAVTGTVFLRHAADRHVRGLAS